MAPYLLTLAVCGMLNKIHTHKYVMLIICIYNNLYPVYLQHSSHKHVFGLNIFIHNSVKIHTHKKVQHNERI